jgi:rare lipoprotein A (peptidoglycan hydrolase)
LKPLGGLNIVAGSRFTLGRSLDLSLRAAQKIGITHQGVVRVKITTVKTRRMRNFAASRREVKTFNQRCI